MTEPIEIPDSFPVPGSVAGKRVVLTSASRGLGALVATAFLLAGAYQFLASDAAAFVTGTVLSADGGYLLV